MWRHTWRKNWVNCAVLTSYSAGLRTVLSSRLSHRELRRSLREFHSFLCLPADTTMTSSQGTQFFQQISITWYTSIPFQIPLLTPHLTLSFFFSDNTVADVASKQQTTALFLSTVVTCTRRHAELTKKKKKKNLTNLMGNQCCAREH